MLSNNSKTFNFEKTKILKETGGGGWEGQAGDWASRVSPHLKIVTQIMVLVTDISIS